MSDIYNRLISEGEKEDFTDLLSYGVIYQVGYSQDLPVVVFFPYFCPDDRDITQKIWLLLYENINELKEICPSRYYLNLHTLYILGRNKKFKKNQLCSEHDITKVTIYLDSPNYLSSLFPLFNLEFPEWLYESSNSNNNCCCCSSTIQAVSTEPKEVEIEERRESRYLIDIDKYYKQHNDLPVYIKDIFEYLNKDVKIVGLLRIPGQCTTINAIVKMLLFEKKRLKDINIKYNSYDITGVMKRILNKLSEPLIPCEYFNEIINIETNDKNDIKTVNEIINLWYRILDSLCKSKIEFLKLFFNYLNQLNKNSEINHMGSENISVILTMGGNLIRSENSLDDIKYFENICLFFKVFLDNFDEFEIMNNNKYNNSSNDNLRSSVSSSSLVGSTLHRSRSSNTELNLTRSIKSNTRKTSLRVYDVLDDKMKKILQDNKLNDNESVILRSGNLCIGDILPPSNYHLMNNEEKTEMKLESVINEDLNEEVKSEKNTPRDEGER